MLVGLTARLRWRKHGGDLLQDFPKLGNAPPQMATNFRQDIVGLEDHHKCA